MLHYAYKHMYWILTRNNDTACTVGSSGSWTAAIPTTYNALHDSFKNVSNLPNSNNTKNVCLSANEIGDVFRL